jgi:ketosteroid isomerase-like protein
MSKSADLVRAFYEAAAAGDPAAMDIFAPEVEFRMPDVLPHGGTIHGREALGSYFGEVQGRWEDFRAELDDLVDGGERVVAMGRFCGRPRASGRYVEVPFALVWTVRDGRAVRVDEYTDTALLIDALRPTGPSSGVGA